MRELDKTFDFLVVGGGIVGTATAYKLSLLYPGSRIALLEKEKELACHQTGRNSGVIHSGIYYRPGSLKAENCRKGREQLVAFAKEQGLPHSICGKMIVATTEKELPELDRIYNNGVLNKTPGLKYLDHREIHEKEPYIEGLRAIWVPSAGIIDYVAVANRFTSLMLDSNAQNRCFTNCEVQGIARRGRQVEVSTSVGKFQAQKLIVCAGLHADRLARFDNARAGMQVVGFRGDYYELLEHARHKVNNLVYPVPDPKYPFLGVHYTPMINGTVECGPNAVFTFKREGYSRTSFSFKDSLEALSYPGTWKLFLRNWSKGLDEYRRAFSKRLFVRELQRMMPSIRFEDVVATRSGVRAQAVGPDGAMIDDFKIVVKEGVIHVLNAPSPAATACLAIADEILAKLKDPGQNA